MLCIQDIKIVEVDESEIRMQHLPRPHLLVCADPSEYPEYEVIETEVIRGRRFVNHRGQEFCIGMSKAVQDVIGLPFEAFEIMREESEERFKRGVTLDKELCEIKATKFMGRLKFLFTGSI